MAMTAWHLMTLWFVYYCRLLIFLVTCNNFFCICILYFYALFQLLWFAFVFTSEEFLLLSLICVAFELLLWGRAWNVTFAKEKQTENTRTHKRLKAQTRIVKWAQVFPPITVVVVALQKCSSDKCLPQLIAEFIDFWKLPRILKHKMHANIIPHTHKHTLAYVRHERGVQINAIEFVPV